MVRRPHARRVRFAHRGNMTFDAGAVERLLIRVKESDHGRDLEGLPQVLLRC